MPGRRLPKGAYALPGGGHAVDRGGQVIVVDTGRVHDRREVGQFPDFESLARTFRRLTEQRRRVAADPTNDPQIVTA